MSKTRYYIESSLVPRTEVFPSFSGDMSWTKEDDVLYFTYGAKDKLRLVGDDYDLIKQHQDAECSYFYLDIETLCNSEYSHHWRGKFSVLGSKENEDRCWFDINPVPDTKVTCYEENLADEHIFFPSSNMLTVVSIGGNYETAECFDFTASVTEDSEPVNSCLPDPESWCLKSNVIEEVLLGGGDNFQQTTTWHRETFTTSCVDGQPVEPVFGTGWEILSEDCAGAGSTTWWKCPPSANGDVLGPYTQGARFTQILEKLNNFLGCGFNIVSNFFGINPDGTAPDNDAYQFALTDLSDVTMHQKSDVKRKYDSNLSTSISWKIKLEDLVNDLRELFNVYVDPSDETNLRIEHYSYFATRLGLDRSTESMDMELEYRVKDDLKREKYFFVDELASEQFLAKDITYTCGKETKERRCKLFSTDLAYIENTVNEDRISDEKFVLIANRDVDGELVLIDGNSPLSWPVLHDRLHRDGRAFKYGTLNGSDTNFSSWLPYIQQKPFKTDLCCSESFNARDLVVTRKGPAVIQEATYNLFTNRLELQPSY